MQAHFENAKSHKAVSKQHNSHYCNNAQRITFVSVFFPSCLQSLPVDIAEHLEAETL